MWSDAINNDQKKILSSRIIRLLHVKLPSATHGLTGEDNHHQKTTTSSFSPSLSFSLISLPFFTRIFVDGDHQGPEEKEEQKEHHPFPQKYLSCQFSVWVLLSYQEKEFFDLSDFYTEWTATFQTLGSWSSSASGSMKIRRENSFFFLIVSCIKS